MTLFSRINLALGAFLILAGIIYGFVAREYEGLTLIFTVAGGALLVGVYVARAVQRARAWAAAQPAGAAAGESEPHVAPTIWPLVFALAMLGLVIGAVQSPWALTGGGVLLVVALIGWNLDVLRQWRHHHETADAGAAHGGPHAGTGQ